MASFLNALFGSKPSVPDLPKLDLGTEQQTAIKNNLAALPGAEDLVSQANAFSQSQIQKMLEKVIPNYNAITGSAGDALENMIKGNVPISDQMAQWDKSVAGAFSRGFGGAPAMGSLVARDLGIQQLDMITKGLSSAESWLKTMDSLYQPGQINVASMFITPSQQAGFDVEERNTKFQRDYLQNQISAMPDPVFSAIEQEVFQLAKAYVGSMGGGMGGGGKDPSPIQNYSNFRANLGSSNDFGGELS